VTAGNLLTQWARLLLSSLADAGVREVVLSPGSRSTPFMVAASSEPRLVCHDSLDERAGGFFGLGQARVTGRPSLLICTSGTAGAHYLPAVIEAGLSFLPLLVLTSDRPLELQDAGAAQTIDQIKLMGSFTRRFYELGNPDPAPEALSGLRRLAAQAVHFSRFPVPGAVHLNARARKPLEPRPALTDEERDLEARVDRLMAQPIVRPSAPVATPDEGALDSLAERCRSVERGLIVCGPAQTGHAALRPVVGAFARVTGFPVLAETTSQLRRGARVEEGVARCDAFDAILRSASFRADNPVQLIIQIGAPPASSGFEQNLAGHDHVDHVVILPYGWHDPASSATDLLIGDPRLILEGLVERLRKSVGPADDASASQSRWAKVFGIADRRAWDVVDAELVPNAPDAQLDEGRAVRTVMDSLPPGSLFMVGNSLPIREIDTFCPSGGPDVTVLSQRGANGIDGLIAAASGSAAVQDQPLTLLLGDVSFLHDLTGLALARWASVPLVIVVLNNGGGRIFEQLPLATAPNIPPGIMDHVVTPHDADLEHAALLFGYPYRSASTAHDLDKALEDAYGRPGCTVVEVPLAPHGAAEQHRRIFARVDEAVSRLTIDAIDTLD
jgi:2-succinyl-5-enolpyruvyl-6-hydroxy-3-cyclohexene-1-carboxylate synthase